MDLIINILLLVIGFVILIKGANTLVEGASSIAKKFSVSGLVIGLTIVAFGTSAPELVVNILAAFNENTDLAISNIVGSNISNILLILGVTAMVYPIKTPTSTIKLETPFALGVVIILGALMADIYLGVGDINQLSRSDSIVLLVLFILFLVYTFRLAKKGKINNDDGEIIVMSNIKATIFIVLGLAGLTLGGQLIVDNAVKIAHLFGVPNSFIGLTIVAIGTSLPELATSLVAAKNKKTDLAIGNVIGSNIFNTLWILGLTGTIFPLKGYPGLTFDIYINIIATLLIFVFAFTSKKWVIDKHEGLIFVFLYFSYLGYLIYNVI